MKRKMLALGLFSLCTLAFIASDSQAFCGLFHHNRCVTHITCRPYNAFTPICWGNLVCDGCCPSPCGVASGCMPMQMGMPSWATNSCASAYRGPMGGPDYTRVSDMPMPPIHTNPYTAPMPQPLPMNPGTTMMYPPAGVAQANYYPMYMPQMPNYYMPTYYNPYQPWQPTPYYWYGQGR